MDKRIRLIIADDHPAVRKALAARLELEPDLEVIGEAVDGREAIKLAEELSPDVVVMDAAMVPMSGADATRSIMASRPAVRVIGLSMHDSAWMEDLMLEAGARAFVEKSAPLDDLIAAIRSAVRGPVYTV